MKTVWKFPFVVADEVSITMPRGAWILHVECQGDQSCVWAMVDHDQPDRVQRRFRIAGTGRPLPDWYVTWKFVGTFMMWKGKLVWHVWDLGET